MLLIQFCNFAKYQRGNITLLPSFFYFLFHLSNYRNNIIQIGCVPRRQAFLFHFPDTFSILDSQAYFLLTKALIQQIDGAHQGSVAGIAVIKQRNLNGILWHNLQ
jgi:hypothetical protein